MSAEPLTALLAELTLLEKAALLSGADVWKTRPIPRLGVPSIWMADGPHGVRKQLGASDHLGLGESKPATCFPTGATIANTWDEELAEQIGIALGAEAAEQGVHVLLGPGLNIKRSPLGGRNFEYFSEDPELSGRLAAAYVRGIQSQGVAATPKHFAVNSQELRRMVSNSVIDERTLRELYLTAFEIVVRESSPWALMSAYNLVNGVYAHENAPLLTTILRDEWGFDGAVISDWGGGDDAVSAVAAGGTIEMPSPGYESAQEIVAAVENGSLDIADVDARVTEVLRLVERVTVAGTPQPTDAAAHHALARTAAAEGAVLLRNEGGVLPLSPSTRVGLIGDFARLPRYQGAGSSAVNPTQLSTLEDAITRTDLVLTGFAQGFSRDGSSGAPLHADAVTLAQRSDVVVLALGLPESSETEGLDRAHLQLPAHQIDLLRAVAATDTPVVVVLSGGGAIETPWASLTAGLVHGYLGGQAGAEGICDVLTGVVNPGGRLAESLPVRLSDDPTAAIFPAEGPAIYSEGLLSRYRFHDTAKVAPAFGFGFGLSYTTFEYSSLSVSADGAEFTVRNTGARAGSDVAQLYVGRVSPNELSRPTRELKGFSKVRLEAGERAVVRIPFTSRTFRYFDVAANAWQVEAGEYKIDVGSHLGDLPLSFTLSVPGVAAETTAELSSLEPPSPTDGLVGVNSPIDELRHARSGLARLLVRVLDRRLHRQDHGLPPDIIAVFALNAPVRIVHKMSGGRIGPGVTRGVLTWVNGRALRGIRQIVMGYFGGVRAEQNTRKKFERQAGID